MDSYRNFSALHAEKPSVEHSLQDDISLKYYTQYIVW